MKHWLEPVTLDGTTVCLAPLEPHHFKPLFDLAEGQDLWRWFPVSIASESEMAIQLEKAIEARENGTELPFVTLLRATGEVVGSTRFLNLSRENRRLEIGWTWVGPRWQRTQVNTEAKYLMLKHAFETLQCIRVELKTDSLNQTSQDAMTRLGCLREGVLRSHMITHTGRARDTVYFSVIASEWAALKQRLQEKLSARKKAV